MIVLMWKSKRFLGKVCMLCKAYYALCGKLSIN